jgi:uncharacterized protein YggE
MLIGALALTSSSAALAQAPAPGGTRSVSVTGEGVASAPAAFVVLQGAIFGRGDNGSKAFDAHQQAKNKVEKEFAGGDFKVGLEFGGERLAPTAVDLEAMEDIAIAVEEGDEPPAAEATPVAVVEMVSFRVEIASDMERAQIVRKVAAVIDRGRKAGVRFSLGGDYGGYGGIMALAGAGSVARFVAAEPEKLVDRAVENAVKDARAKAERLAALAGGKIGRVLSIAESDADVYSEEYYDVDEALAEFMSQRAGGEISAASNRPIEVKRRIQVVFELTD